MSGPSEAERLEALKARIAAARQAQDQAPGTKAEDHHSQAQLAWRMVIELVVGLGIGFGIGYGLDRMLGSTPWMMMVFTILGFIAGVKTMMRSAEEVGRKRSAEPDQNERHTEAAARTGGTGAAVTGNDEPGQANGDERRGRPE